jgi:hypothetical protein
VGSLGSLVSGPGSTAGHHSGGRSATRWSRVVLTSMLAAVVLALGASVALRYTQTELADVIGISADEIFERRGQERLGVGLGGFVVLLAVAPGLLVGGIATVVAGLRGWPMVVPPLLAASTGSLGSAVGAAAQVSTTAQLGAAATGMAAGASLGVAVADLVRRRGP